MADFLIKVWGVFAMSFRLFIPEDLQYGRMSAMDARPGRMQRTMQQVLIKALVSGLDQEGDTGGTDATGTGDAEEAMSPRFQQALARFSGELATLSIGKTNKSARADLWRRLLEAQRILEEAETQRAHQDGTGRDIKQIDDADSLIDEDDATHDPVDPVEKRTTRALFCLALYGLCGAFAAEHLKRTEVGFESGPEGWEDEDEDEEDGEGSAQTPLPDLDEALSVSRAFVVRTISELLERSFPDLLERDNPDLARAERRLLSGVLLDCCLSSIEDWVDVVKSEGVYHVIVTDEGIAKRFQRVAIELPFSVPPQPLRKPVAYPTDPEDGGKSAEGNFTIDLISYRRRNRFLRNFHDEAARHASPQFKNYIRAVNAQMAVGWRLNLPLLQAVESLVQRARTGSRMDRTARWVREALYLPSRTTPRRTYQRPAEFLDHPLMQAAIGELAVRNDDGSQPVFYLPWFADYRGRIYAATPWLTPQGGDVQRALLEFAKGRPLDGLGWKALRRHGANLVSKSRVLSDLNIIGRTSLTLEERERWVEQNEAQIWASAADPCEEDFWRDVAGGSEIQFLAFCLTYRQAMEEPQAPVHLPVQIDGTCNGLQHISALTGDEELACAVNVLEDGSGLPRDIYMELAEATRMRIRSGETAVSPKDPVGRQVEEWLSSSGLLDDLVDRSTAKKVIMTIPYGAGETAQIAHVLEQLLPSLQNATIDNLPAALDPKTEQPPIHRDLLKEVRRVFHRWLREQHNRLYDRELDDRARDKKRIQLRQWYRLWDPRDLLPFRLGLPLAKVIVAHLRAALSQKHPSVDEFKKFLETSASRLNRMPLLWLTPLDFPVCQNQFRLEGPHLDAHILLPEDKAEAGGGETRREVRVDAKCLSEEVDKGAASAQRRALMPNLIHAFDATHLASTMRAAGRRQVSQFGSIHDCFLVHPNDADTLAEVVRHTFAHLHRADEHGTHKAFADWCGCMELLRLLRTSEAPNWIVKALDDPGCLAETQLREEDRKVVEALRAMPDNREMQLVLAKCALQFRGETIGTLPAARKGEITLEFPSALFASDGDQDRVSQYLFS
ncbi:hypothetical protein HUK65_13700 [Rhodobacteraceae bacterium 2376]|uniref:DNA-directed RNA polymerase n=1 Tax=Rhabdonatronobacter sediminivivens TaxID=2743469 RepID=A0A7Z0KZ67_9RHOB|nr:DNA-directed RNA polymerase [Rhabdonatronobacter sediminivivens]NYS26044.1 hypothetical protein [Rhabdonatronobacter sediminivivens]